MSVIIRLQNLPWSANALDIRQYFSGLSIPEGGVHIVGGELGDAFIAFSTDEDARQAFQRNNGKIKSIQITLTLSSRTEMQRIIEAARSQSYSAFLQSAPAQSAPVQSAPTPMPAAIPSVIPAIAPEVKIDLSKDTRDNKIDKKDRKRSRSRDRRERSRDKDRRDRRYRDRSRSRSRDRRRRRDKSRSRSRDRISRSRDNSRRRSSENAFPIAREQKKIEPWAQNDPMVQNQIVPNIIAANLANNFEELRRNLNVISPALSGNGFQSNILCNRGRESWPQSRVPSLKSDDDYSQSSDNNFPIEQRNLFNNRSLQFGPDRRKNVIQKNNSVEFDSRTSFDPRLSPNCCVKVEPFYGAYGDLRRFFQGCFISSRGIKFINDKSGTRTGIVFVQFGNPQSKVEALTRNNENFNGVNLSVKHIDDEDFENAVDRFVPKIEDEEDYRQMKFVPNKNRFFNKLERTDDAPRVFTCLTVEDLPTYVKEQDILKMFSHYPLTGILLPPKGRGNHIAYVKFSNSDDAKKATLETSLHVIEGKAVSVKPCRDEDFERINQEHDVKITPPVQIKKFDSDCLSITGLPLKTTDRDVADFFSDIGVIPTKIHLVNNDSGFTGNAYCEFESFEEAEKASAKNACVLGTHLINVVPVSRKEINESIGVQDSLEITKGPLSKEREESVSSPSSRSKNSIDDSKHLESKLNDEKFLNNHQQMTFNQRNNVEGNQRGRGGFIGRGGRGRGFGLQPLRNNMPDDIAPPGCTVYMDNIPYKARTDDILDFFEGYNVTNTVSRRFNPNNTPSAEARVVFHTPEDAYIAVRDKHMQTIWDRPIYLRQV